MKTRLVQFLFAFVGCMSASPPAEANGYFPQGECGIAVAARQSLAEAREWIAEWREGATNFNTLRKKDTEHQIETVGAELRGMMRGLMKSKGKGRN